MTFYQELQLNQAGSKSLLKNSKTMKEKLYHAFVYMVKIAVTMVFCFAFVTASSIISVSYTHLAVSAFFPQTPVFPVQPVHPAVCSH